MSEDNVISLNAFGDLIEPNGKREYKQEKPTAPAPIGKEIIPLTLVTKDEKPVLLPDSTKEEGRYSRGSKQANQVAGKVLMHMAQTKLLHWETRSRAEHEALDELFKRLIKIGDHLVESVMGKYGRPEFESEFMVAFQDINSINLQNFIDGIVEFLVGMTEVLDPKYDTDLLNIRDEILSSINKLKYLLTLKS